MKKIIILTIIFVNTLFSNDLNLKFETNSYEINSAQKMQLDKYIDYLFSNFQLSIVVKGHTDSVGSKKDNIILSDKRAQTVKNYIISAGIVNSRVESIACGETSPKVKNNTAKNRQINRRVETKEFVTFQ